MRQPQVTYFDPDGDTRLVLPPPQQQRCSSEDDAHGPPSPPPPPSRVFVVSSKAMALACDVWDRMLSPDGNFKEAQQRRKDGGELEVELPDDDPDGLAVLLNIAHLNFDRVPLEIDFQTLVKVAALTEKYGATRIVRPWIPGWIKANEELVEKEGYEEWLWVAWAFGEKEKFERLAARLVLKSRVDSEGQCVVTAGGRILDPSSDDVYLPPDIIGMAALSWYGKIRQADITIKEGILRARQDTITRLLSCCYDLVDEYLSDEDGFRCKEQSENTSHRRGCDALSFGTLIFSLKKVGLAPERKTATETECSIEELAEKIESVDIDGYTRDDGYRSRYHHSCNPKYELRDKVGKAVHNRGTPIRDCHQHHLERKLAELTGPLPDRTSRRKNLKNGRLPSKIEEA